MSAISKKGPVYDSGECRCCGATKRCRLLNVEYLFMGQKEIYSEMFVDCFGLMLSHLDGDEQERMICATCVTRLREARDFRSQVLRCEEKLLKANIQLADNSNIVDEHNFKVEVEIGPKEEPVNEINHDDDIYPDIYNSQDDDQIVDRSSPESPKPLKRTRLMRRAKSKHSEEKVGRKSRKPSVLDNLKARKEMQISIKRTKEKLKKVLRKEKSSEIVRLEGNRYQKSTKAFFNTVTIVENSYVCPFISIFNDFYCDYCRQKFTDHQSLREHTMIHDPSTFKDAIMDSMRRFGRKKTQLDIQRIDCRLCPEPINDIETFKKHITNVHGKSIYPVENEFLQYRVTPNLECVECGNSFPLFQALKKHMAEHFGSYTCDKCGMHFFNESYLIAHQKNHDTDSKPELYTCEECGRSFKLKYSRDMHVTTQHRKEAAFQCIKCDDMFFSSRQRFRHMMEVHEEKSTIQCSQCDKVYDNRKTLLDHMRRIHVKMLKHKCNLCERRFYLPSMLKDHKAIHTGEKNFKCDFCGKSYPRLKSLKVHMQAHVLVKKYKCTHCSASYGQNVSLKNHIKRQHQRAELEGGLGIS